MLITVYNKQKDLSLSLTNLKKTLPFLFQHLHVFTDELIVHFVSKKRIQKIHKDFFSDPTPTDCISFPLDPPRKKPTSSGNHEILGEIFVCPQVALEYAQLHSRDVYQEVLLYVIHGILHLLGYDDIDPHARRNMRRMERKCMLLCHSLSLAKKRLS